MKKFKTFILTVFLAGSGLANAAPTFSGLLAGSAGLRADIPNKSGDEKLYVPMAGLAAGQLNFTDWCILRAGLEMRADNFAFTDLLDGANATLKVQEVSLVFTSRAVTMTNYFSIFLGSYEQIGSDTFLMRQFGIEPVSSPLLHSTTSLSGTPLYTNEGTGLSYIVHFDRAPLATGAYIYIDEDDEDDLTLNFDWRLAFATRLVTMDFSAGIGAPLENKYNDEDVVLMIDTLNLHGGINLLLGNRYTHSLLIQFGIKNLTLKGDSPKCLGGDDFSLLFEPRINFETWRLNLTLFALDKENIEQLLYLEERMGIALSIFKDDIEVKNGTLTFGVHAIGAFGNINLIDLYKWNGMDDMTVNVFLTPFVKLPLSPNTEMEALAQLGLRDITDDIRFNFKIIAGFKRKF